MNLENLLNPISKNDFFQKYWTRQDIYIPNQADKLNKLINLDSFISELNQNLNSYSFPKLEFIKDGQSVPFEEYSQITPFKRVGCKRQYSREKINSLSKKGYTLTMRRVDQLTKNLTEARKTLQGEFKEIVNMNAYVSHPSTFGFNPHYDTHEVFVLQLEGQKEWKLFGNTFLNPLPLQYSKQLEKPKVEVKEYTLSKGDLLYIPRGMWHSAQTTTVSSFHITIGIHCRTLLDYTISELEKNSLFRGNLRSPADFNNESDHNFTIDKLKEKINQIEISDSNITSLFKDNNKEEFDLTSVDLNFKL